MAAEILDKIIFGDLTVSNFLGAVIILLFAVILSKIIAIYLRRSLKDKLSKDHLETIIKIIYFTITIIALVSIIPNPSGLLLAGGIFGLIIGFASQSIVSNLISGLFLMIERPIKIGNSVNINEVSGIVEDISIISTVIRTFDGLYIRMPNEKVFTNNITNNDANIVRRFEYNVGIRYNDDADAAIEIINNLIDEHPFVLKIPSPTIFVGNLGDNAVNIVVKIWSPSSEWYGVKIELLWKIKAILEENGIEIAFPQRTVWFANELQKREIGKDTSNHER